MHDRYIFWKQTIVKGYSYSHMNMSPKSNLIYLSNHKHHLQCNPKCCQYSSGCAIMDFVCLQVQSHIVLACPDQDFWQSAQLKSCTAVCKQFIASQTIIPHKSDRQWGNWAIKAAPTKFYWPLTVLVTKSFTTTNNLYYFTTTNNPYLWLSPCDNLSHHHRSCPWVQHNWSKLISLKPSCYSRHHLSLVRQPTGDTWWP